MDNSSSQEFSGFFELGQISSIFSHISQFFAEICQKKE